MPDGLQGLWDDFCLVHIKLPELLHTRHCRLTQHQHPHTRTHAHTQILFLIAANNLTCLSPPPPQKKGPSQLHEIAHPGDNIRITRAAPKHRFVLGKQIPPLADLHAQQATLQQWKIGGREGKRLMMTRVLRSKQRTHTHTHTHTRTSPTAHTHILVALRPFDRSARRIMASPCLPCTKPNEKCREQQTETERQIEKQTRRG